ncbi:hypothetical protein GPECTOR_94g651 [Gonium pectorale]|uniref:Uncharacterized protein n=1 Tax=Gonium pectorale TaxID=33097 RepID=A0A150G0F0_GONPE|nr:hypothetical protein GPECTOR_94g651 [Gonium pectorale]|eukprot:KXZ43329.1 hypothetical protein GPECTOR_94g651 [Gonium pectorale]
MFSGKLNTGKALESIRAKYGFKRAADGRVYVRAANGTYFAVRLDMEVPGGLLLRNTSSGEVFALQTQALQQVDLTSDQVVILVLGDGEWENAMSPITVEDEDGATKTLTLKENEFRNVVGLISMTDQGQEGEEDK